MESCTKIENSIVKSDYFQENLQKLLSILQPSFYCLNLIVKVLLYGPDGSGKRTLAKMASKSLNMNFCEERVADLFDENIVGTEKKIKATLGKMSALAPCLIYLTGYELFCKLEEQDLDRVEYCLKESLEDLFLGPPKQPIIFIGATNDFDQIYRTPLSHLFQHNVPISSPTLKQAENIIDLIKSELELEFETKKVLKNCSNSDYYIGNLIHLIACAEVNAQSKLEQEEVSSDEDEGTRWLDVGGLSDVKREIIDTIQMSLDYPQLKKSGLRRTGILLYGPPGTGKTLLAKAVATECNLNFINVRGPELLNEYVGQSEDNVRKLFQRARENSPSVIFFDEIDSLAPNRGQAGDSGGVMDRMVSQILAEMDGAGNCDNMFVIGATNRVDLVDPSLLRPGRFDKVLEVPIPSSKEHRLEILKALTRKMKLSDDVNLELIETKVGANLSGAEFQSLCSRALHKTFNRCVEDIESGKANEDNVEILTTLEDFLQSIEEQN